MPEYLAPGVYVEETSFRAKSIQGVGTSTTAFVGPTRKGPLGMVSDVITSFGEFERIYGGLASLTIGGAVTTNFMAHAAKAFFDNGGARLYVARTFTSAAVSGNRTLVANSAAAAVEDGANAAVGRFRARSPGSGLNGFIIAYQKLTPATATTLNAAPTGSMAQTGGNTYFVKAANGVWDDDAGDPLDFATLTADARLVTVNLEIRPGASAADGDAEGGPIVIEGLGLGDGHPRQLAEALSQNPTSRGGQLSQPYWFDPVGNTSPFALREALFANNGEVSVAYPLTGGIDGDTSVTTDADAQNLSYEEALALVEEVSDVAIVAAPGSSATAEAQGVRLALISHAERMRYRIAVLDTAAGAAVGDARTVRAGMDSKYAALYYPWVVVPNPEARPSDDTIAKELALPPSGFVCGIYARNDIQRGVWKAPANEVVRGALRFERELSKGEQEVLNPEGINCLRTFFGRGNRVWGARTISSDPEWIYVNVRRYFNYVENSIDRSTQWAVFEPNGPALWSNITDTISSFLFAEWRSGALLGATPEEAYFVRCDRSTMTQADLDNGRLICEIGIAAIKPAEFVIFRIGQKTADATN
jgi:uncharacterized protein